MSNENTKTELSERPEVRSSEWLAEWEAALDQIEKADRMTPGGTYHWRTVMKIRFGINEIIDSCRRHSANDGSSATGELRETFDADKTKQTDGSR